MSPSIAGVSPRYLGVRAYASAHSQASPAAYHLFPRVHSTSWHGPGGRFFTEVDGGGWSYWKSSGLQ